MDERVCGGGEPPVSRTSGSVVRKRLLNLVDVSADRIVVLEAPSGCGKSVLARQVVQIGGFQRVLWLDFANNELSHRALAERLLDQLGLDVSVTNEVNAPWAIAQVAESDDETQITDCLRQLGGQRTALVLDNVAVGVDGGRIAALVGCFLRFAGDGSRAIVASRAKPGEMVFSEPALLLSADELRLELSEAMEMHGALISARPEETEVAELLEWSACHVASFLVLSRYVALRGRESVANNSLPPSLSAQLRAVAASGLDTANRRALLGCALLGTGSESELSAILERRVDLREVALSIPLVSLHANRSGAMLFSCHELASTAFCSLSWATDNVPAHRDLVSRILTRLRDRRDFSRLIRVRIEFDAEGLEDCLEECGRELLDGGFTGVLGVALERVPVDVLISRPRLLVLDASVSYAVLDFQEAGRKASVARELARHACDLETEIEALTIIDGSLFIRGELAASQRCLESLLELAGPRLPVSAELLVRSRLVMGFGQLGDLAAVRRHVGALGSVLSCAEESEPARVRCELRVASTVHGLVGDVRTGIRHVGSLLTRAGISAALRYEAMANLAGMLIEMGRLRRANSVVSESASLIEDYDLRAFVPSLGGTRCCLNAGAGELQSAVVCSDSLLSGMLSQGDLINANYHRLYRSLILAAAGQVDDGLAAAEEALEYFAANQVTVFIWHSMIEMCACLLALGDWRSARAQLEGVRAAIDSAGYPYHLLKADLILAEVERLDGQVSKAVARLAAHREYLLSENANWVVAMDLHVFPNLLGILAEAVLPSHLPLHMLRMAGDEVLDVGLVGAGDWMDPGSLSALRMHARPARTGPERDVAERSVGTGCRVRLFGGFAVVAPHGLVDDGDWKKRKARLLFAMLVVRRGRDVPREQLFEYLWPEMDEDRAKNNFYVVFNAMKNALTDGKGKGRPCPYVNSKAGVCSIVESTVRSDLDDFDLALSEARAAEARGDRPVAVDRYARLAEIYRGDMLPGDVYDDWFSPLREHYRQEFSDAMLRGGALLESDGDVRGALHLVRKALSHDAWREDLYQTAIGYQIAAGQRSAAVETYMACKAKLAEDLGLDPSVETRKLYDQILAMEGDDGIFPADR